MDTLISMQVFREVVSLNSFNQAAAKMGISNAMATKHIRHLENHLSARLLNRTSRRLSLTEVGQNYYQECCKILDQVDNAKLAAQTGTAHPTGTLKLSAPVWCAVPFFANLLSQYQLIYPKVKLSLYLDNNFTNLAATGMDVALRVTPRPDTTAQMRQLATITFQWVAAPSYIAAFGNPETVEALSQHRGVWPNYNNIENPLQPNVDSNNSTMMLQCVIAGMGIARMPSWLVQEHIDAGRLVVLLPEEEKFTLPLYAVHLQKNYVSAKVKTFVDFMENRLSQLP